ncbi:MAG: ribosome assembly RNA-binding protein YhbY [Vicinamibacterales bacterium]
MSVSLTPRERAHLKARAHALEPKVMVGHGGLTPAVIAEIDRALTAHELIKVKILGDDREARETIGDEICAATDAAPVQRVGKIIALWRPKPAPVKE